MKYNFYIYIQHLSLYELEVRENVDDARIFTFFSNFYTVINNNLCKNKFNFGNRGQIFRFWELTSKKRRNYLLYFLLKLFFMTNSLEKNRLAQYPERSRFCHTVLSLNKHKQFVMWIICYAPCPSVKLHSKAIWYWILYNTCIYEYMYHHIATFYNVYRSD